MKYIILTIALLFLPLSFSSAQSFGIGNQGLGIDLEPSFPDPHSEVILNLNDYSLPAQVTGITWKIDGKVLSGTANNRSVTIETKGAGEETVIEAVVELAGRTTVSTKRVIRPVYLDIVVEPQTKTPAFYQGRALPSIGSKVNLTALISGNNTPQSDLLYTWKLDNTVIEGGAVRGKNKVTINTPNGYFFLVTLDVTTLQGESIMSRTISIISVNPQIHFYESSTLYGIKNIPVTNFNLIGNSATIQAEPYYLDILTYNTPDLVEWEIDGNKNENSSYNPYAITLARPQDISGASEINFHVRNLTQLLQGGKGSFQVNF